MEHLKNSFDEPARVIKRDDAPAETVYALTFREGFLNYFRLKFSKESFNRFMKDSFPQKTDSAKEKIRKIIMDISFVLLVLGLSYMVFYYAGYRERIKDLGDWKTTIDNIDETKLFPFEIEKLWENIRDQYPDVDFPEGMQLKFASLYAVNQDTVGVLSIENKEIWTPVLQNKKSPDYYLWKDLYGEYNRYGNPYVDARCTIEKGKFSQNTIIYGHNTHDKLGFNKLISYMTVDGYREAPVITLDTLYEKTQWKIFAVILTNSTSVADKGHLFDYLIADFGSDAAFMNVINGINQRSMIKTDVDVNKDDKIITLYTCYQDIFDGGRLVVFGRLLREDESAEVDVSKAYFNKNARYPQAYYDQKGLTNPFNYPDISETTEADSTTLTEETTAPVTQDTTASGTENTTASQSESTTAALSENTTAAAEVTAAPEATTQSVAATLPPEEQTTNAPATETATQPAVTQPAATQPAATQPAATQPAATQPAATQPAATQPAATQPAVTP